MKVEYIYGVTVDRFGKSPKKHIMSINRTLEVM